MKRTASRSAAVMISMAVLAGLAGTAAARDEAGPAPAPAAEASRQAAPAAAPAPAATPATPEAKVPAKPVEAKPLTDHVKKGLAWLVRQQNADGGWNQGEVSAERGRAGEQIEKSNVADTCVAALALVRAGNTPSKGEYAESLRKALDFVCGHVERSKPEGLLITDIQGTRVQSKLGSTVDTFAAALLLAECRTAMPDEPSRKRLVAALDKVMDKIEKNQKPDGRWVDANDGWAGALCQSLGHKAINRAAQQGAKVSEEALVRAEKFAKAGLDPKSGAVAATGSAGIDLYARASNLQSFQDSDNTNKAKAGEYAERREAAAQKQRQGEQQLAVAQAAKDDKAAAAATVAVADAVADMKQVDARIEGAKENADALKLARDEVVKRLDDQQFVAGFGSNGGEEFLSYMNIGESLVLEGGEAFAKWDKSMAQNLNRVQNEDGSWSGHHCITGRTFCTSAALLTLTVDRSVTSVAAATPATDAQKAVANK